MCNINLLSNTKAVKLMQLGKKYIFLWIGEGNEDT